MVGLVWQVLGLEIWLVKRLYATWVKVVKLDRVLWPGLGVVVR